MQHTKKTPHRGQTVQGGKVLHFDAHNTNSSTPPHFDNHLGWPWIVSVHKAKVFRIPTKLMDGFPKTCLTCGEPFTLSIETEFIATTVRDGRENYCPLCLFEKLREAIDATTL